jgi:hypothetical protein
MVSAIGSVHASRAPGLVLAAALLTSCAGLVGEPPSATQSKRDGPPTQVVRDVAEPSEGQVARLQTDPLDCSALRPARAPLRRLTPLQYRNTVRDMFEGRVEPGPSFPEQTRTESRRASGFSNDPERNVVGEATAEQIMIAAEETAEALIPALPALLPCSVAPQPPEDCARQFVARYGRRAFRRPVSAEETDTLLSVHRLGVRFGEDFADGIAAMTAALLQMPAFLYLPEAGVPLTAGVRALTDLELASRLSYLFWDSAPDEVLLQAAERGELRAPNRLQNEVRRLLGDPRARPALVRFFREWMHVQPLRPGDRVDPALDERLSAALDEGLGRQLRAAIEEGWSLRKLLTSTETFVNARLAEHLGLPAGTAASDAEWVKASLDPAAHAGLVTHPAVMAGLSHAQEPSYVRRGVFVIERLLCQPLGSPPANAQSVFEALPLPPEASALERSASVRARPDCRGCHVKIDPVGLAFNAFDELGRVRSADRHGNAVPTAGTSTLFSPAGRAFAGASDLLGQVAASGLAEPCFSRQWVRFTFGRLDGSDDACLVRELSSRLSGQGGSIFEMLFALVASDAFAHRTVRELP